jgi:hypothetical protein
MPRSVRVVFTDNPVIILQKKLSPFSLAVFIHLQMQKCLTVTRLLSKKISKRGRREHQAQAALEQSEGEVAESRAMATAAHLSVHARSPDPPSRLRCRAFKQGPDPDAPRSRRRKGPLYTLKAAIQGLAGSRAAAAEVYGGEYQRAVEKAEEVFFSVRPGPALSRPRTRPDKFGVFFSFLFLVVVPTIR